MGIRSREQTWPPKNILFAATEAFTLLTQVFAIAARHADRQGSAAIQSRRSDNRCRVLARLVLLAATFLRAVVKRNGADRPFDDELRETVRGAA
jgi:hypothetical protein